MDLDDANLTPEQMDEQESRFVHDLVNSGRLEQAGREAVAEQRRLGIPVTYKRGDEIVREHADGRVEVLAVVPSVTVTLPPGVRRLGGR